MTANSKGVVRCDCAMCSGNYACGGDMEGPVRAQPVYIGMDFGSEPASSWRFESSVGSFPSFPPILDVHVWGVPNRLYGATINSEGDAV